MGTLFPPILPAPGGPKESQFHADFHTTTPLRGKREVPSSLFPPRGKREVPSSLFPREEGSSLFPNREEGSSLSPLPSKRVERSSLFPFPWRFPLHPSSLFPLRALPSKREEGSSLFPFPSKREEGSSLCQGIPSSPFPLPSSLLKFPLSSSLLPPGPSLQAGRGNFPLRGKREVLSSLFCLHRTCESFLPVAGKTARTLASLKVKLLGVRRWSPQASSI